MTCRWIACLIVLLAASSSASATQARYSCADGSSLTAEFTPPGAPDASAKLDFAGGERHTLPAALSADGGRYASADIEFWIKGNEARLTRNGVATDCKVR